MIWPRLRFNKCPSCNAPLNVQPARDGLIHCSKCEFRIGPRKMEVIVGQISRRRIDDDHSDELRDDWG